MKCKHGFLVVLCDGGVKPALTFRYQLLVRYHGIQVHQRAFAFHYNSLLLPHAYMFYIHTYIHTYMF